jgi:hypothetical protein
LDLPVSKADPMALGKARALSCACPSPACPVVALRTLWRHAQQRLEAHPDETVLVVDAYGAQVGKEAMVAAFRAAAKAAGMPADVFITGHSPRVTGAQRMALAGVSAWRIQVFGRWGSAAVLKYVRDTLVSIEGSDIAKTVEAAKPMPLHRVLASVQPGTPLVIQDRALEVLHRLPAMPVDSQALRTELMNTITGLRRELAEVSSRTYPQVVVCRGSGIAHRTANSTATHCGWQWSVNPHAFSSAGADYSGRMCRRCATHGVAQGGGGQIPSGSS